MGPEFGRSIGDGIVLVASIAALSAPVALASCAAVPLMLLGYSKAATVAWGLGIATGLGFWGYVRDSR